MPSPQPKHSSGNPAKAIWEDEGYFLGRTLDALISRLRKLLKEDPAVRISNIHATGYKFEVDEP